MQFESEIAPKVIGDSLALGVIFSAIVSDGDNKTHDVPAKAGIYNDIRDAPTIDCFECIVHVAKQMKTNLHKRQDKVLKTTRADKAAMSRALSKKGLGKKMLARKSIICSRGWQACASDSEISALDYYYFSVDSARGTQFRLRAENWHVGADRLIST